MITSNLSINASFQIVPSSNKIYGYKPYLKENSLHMYNLETKEYEVIVKIILRCLKAEKILETDLRLNTDIMKIFIVFWLIHRETKSRQKIRLIKDHENFINFQLIIEKIAKFVERGYSLNNLENLTGLLAIVRFLSIFELNLEVGEKTEGMIEDIL